MIVEVIFSLVLLVGAGISIRDTYLIIRNQRAFHGFPSDKLPEIRELLVGKHKLLALRKIVETAPQWDLSLAVAFLEHLQQRGRLAPKDG